MATHTAACIPARPRRYSPRCPGAVHTQGPALGPYRRPNPGFCPGVACFPITPSFSSRTPSRCHTAFGHHVFLVSGLGPFSQSCLVFHDLDTFEGCLMEKDPVWGWLPSSWRELNVVKKGQNPHHRGGAFSLGSELQCTLSRVVNRDACAGFPPPAQGNQTYHLHRPSSEGSRLAFPPRRFWPTSLWKAAITCPAS